MRQETRADIRTAVDLVVLTVREGRLCALLSRRRQPPFEGLWALPGTLLGERESCGEAAARLMREMLPAVRGWQEQLYTFSDVDRDPRGRILSVSYLVILPGELPDGAVPEGFALFRTAGETLLRPDGTPLGAEEIAFDHARILQTGVRRLRGKIGYTDIAFRFLPDPACFSLGEVQQVFEAVLEAEQDKSNFRRFLLGRNGETGWFRSAGQDTQRRRGRPSQKYALNDSEEAES